jgi:hypothetical protein
MKLCLNDKKKIEEINHLLVTRHDYEKNIQNSEDLSTHIV